MTWEHESTVRSDEHTDPPEAFSTQLIALHQPAGERFVPIALRPGSYTLGRSVGPGSILVPDAKASRSHARLSVDEAVQNLVLEDTSANGTFVNGRRIERASLVAGDVLRIGDTLLSIRREPKPLRDASIEALFGRAPCMAALRHAIGLMARESESVLVHGESGTGKELIARALHDLSGRRGAFVAVNCAAIAPAVAESLLFGHVAGAFTGAHKEHDGYVRAANGGTLFLDEIADLPESIQPKLLRALESGEVVPVGASLPVTCRVRLVAASHKRLESEVQAGRFRGDLFARLSQLTLEAPPLRARREDILPLFARALGTNEVLPVAVLEALVTDPWPYNVRQLFAVAGRVRVLGAREGTRELALFAEGPQRSDSPPAPSTKPPERDAPPSREEILTAIEAASGNVRRAADALGRSRKQVYRYLEAYGIDVESLRKG